MTSKLRSCEVNGIAAKFHKWSTISNVIPPSILVGGHSGGTVQTTVGIVEYGDGSVRECYVSEIKFTDNNS